MAISLAQYAEQKRAEAGESAIQSGIRKRWQERVVANGWHEMGEEGAAKYLADYGQNIGAPKVIQLARQAEAAGCPEVALGFWRQAYEMELGHAPPAEPAAVPAMHEPVEPSNEKAKAREKIKALATALHPGKSRESRRATVKALARIGSAEAVDVLIKALGDNAQQDLRGSIAAALGEIGNARAVDGLTKTLGDHNKHVRAAAASALGRIGSARAVEVLLQALGDGAHQSRDAIALALGETNDVRAAETLIAAVKDDPDGGVRRCAAKALGQIGDVRVVEALIVALRDDTDKRLRQLAAEALGQIEDVRAREALVTAIKDDSDSTVRRHAVESVKRIGDIETVETLMETLRDHREHVRERAAYALGEIGNDRAVEALLTTLADEAEEVRRYAIDALGQIGDTRAVEPLVKATEDDKEGIRIAATNALGQIGDARAVDALAELLHDNTRRARTSAARALGKIGGARGVDVLVEALRDAGGMAKADVAQALGQIGDKRAVEPLLDALQDEAEGVRGAAAKALELIGGIRAEQALQALDGISETGISIDLPPEWEEFRGRIEATIKPYVKVTARVEEDTSLWQSKFGGRPYLPKDIPYPRGSSGRPLFLLAQINFAQIPRLEPFPQEGILQFYVADNDLFGANFDDETVQEGFRILFFPQVIEDEGKLVTDFRFLPERIYFPVFKPSSLTFVRRYAPISGQDYRFEAAVFGQDIPWQGELWEFQEQYYRLFEARGDKIGGYPAFVQDDPRTIKKYKDEGYDVLLLQMVSDQWGDAGVANFFIREEELRKRDFSRVMYNWDCG